MPIAPLESHARVIKGHVRLMSQMSGSVRERNRGTLSLGLAGRVEVSSWLLNCSPRQHIARLRTNMAPTSPGV